MRSAISFSNDSPGHHSWCSPHILRMRNSGYFVARACEGCREHNHWHSTRTTMYDERFARYEPQPSGGEKLALPKGLQVRGALPEDRDALAALVFEREGGEFERHLRDSEQEPGAERSHNLLLIAQVQGRLVGFGRVRYMAPPAADSGKVSQQCMTSGSKGILSSPHGIIPSVLPKTGINFCTSPKPVL
jgi:hypothetical protein